MQMEMNPIRFHSSEVDGIRVHVLPTDRFKTHAISLYIGLPLAEDTVTPSAVIPFVLRRGNESYPETLAFRDQLDRMYGAGFGFDIYKRGNSQVIQFRMDTIEARYVNESRALLEESIAFLGETVTRPALERGAFRGKYVEAEKDTVRKRLEAIINDKMRYAAERCLEEMCEGDPYRLHPLGRREAIGAITPDSLYRFYQERWLRGSAMDLFVVGNASADEVADMVKRSFALNRSDNPTYAPAGLIAQRNTAKTVVERLPVNQGKLNLGLRLPITYGSPDYPAALVYNGILGGFPHSKLFINVREKASLAYYAASRFDGHKGITTIQSGIEAAKYEQALEIIKQQLELLKQGEVSELEMSQTKAMIANQIREMRDSAFEMTAFAYNSVLSGVERDAAALIGAVEAVGLDDVRRIADLVTIDTIYFLRDQGGE